MEQLNTHCTHTHACTHTLPFLLSSTNDAHYHTRMYKQTRLGRSHRILAAHHQSDSSMIRPQTRVSGALKQGVACFNRYMKQEWNVFFSPHRMVVVGLDGKQHLAALCTPSFLIGKIFSMLINFKCPFWFWFFLLTTHLLCARRPQHNRKRMKTNSLKRTLLRCRETAKSFFLIKKKTFIKS